MNRAVNFPNKVNTPKGIDTNPFCENETDTAASSKRLAPLTGYKLSISCEHLRLKRSLNGIRYAH